MSQHSEIPILPPLKRLDFDAVGRAYVEHLCPRKLAQIRDMQLDALFAGHAPDEAHAAVLEAWHDIEVLRPDLLPVLAVAS